MPDQSRFDSRELFRYVRIEQPRITDVAFRAKRCDVLRKVIQKNQTSQIKWAKTFVKSKAAVCTIADLSFPYFDHLKIDTINPISLPTTQDLRDPEAFQKLSIKSDEAYQKDVTSSLASLFAYRTLEMHEKLDTTAKLLSFIDAFPGLAEAREKRPYATPVFERMKLRVQKKTKNTRNKEVDKPSTRHEDIETLSKDIHILWQASNQMRVAKVKEYDAEIATLRRTHFAAPVSSSGSGAVAKKGKKVAKTRHEQETRKRHIAFLRDRNTKLAELRKEKNQLEESCSMENAAILDPSKFAKYAAGRSVKDVRDTQKRVTEAMKKYGIQYGKFCQVYDTAVREVDRDKQVARPSGYDPKCFSENPRIVFDNAIQLLGLGNLIKVEETFIGYNPAEISYIENILPGEVRKREIKSTKYFEQVQETSREEITDTTEETSTTSTQELSSEIESELNTRFNSDIDASVNASGGGTIGVVDASGGATINTGLGIGIDTSLSSSNKSEFSQEIVNKAVEKTKKSTLERRLTRSSSLYETINLHEIDNRSGGNSKNGIYVFLDKEVCVKEITYGKRLFLLANVLLPGKNLLCEKLTKIHLNMLDQGQKPIFDISPEDIYPHNYRELVGKFKASNIKPPPSPTQTISRTYKTDTTNANVEQKEFSVKKMADILVPFFERYKRYMITDQITIPEGYQAQEVIVTVSHGSNGLSIPTHLPFSLTAATVAATPNMLTAIPYMGLTLPYVFWQIAYLASPLLHYNADSSNITVTVANESHDSPYYFFQPDFLIKEVFELLSNFSALTPDILATMQDKITIMMESLGQKAIDMSADLSTLIQATVTSLISQIQAVFSALQTLQNPVNAANIGANFDALVTAIGSVTSTISENYEELMGINFFSPLQTFLDEILELIAGELNSALAEMFEFFTSMFDNTQNLPFYSVAGLRGDISVSMNSISIKPGVTVNLTACVVRTEEALDQWRLDTFSSLYQAYLQQMAEYENRLLTMGAGERIATSPGNMRREEHLAIKELVLHTLNNYVDDHGNDYNLERINFFENTIDWKNMSYRVFNYGPGHKEVHLDKIGVYQHVDQRRKAFLKAHWAQVMIPVHANSHFEAQIHQYFDDGTFNFEGTFSKNELTALYQDLVLGRELIGDGIESPGQRITIPTDFILVQDQLPENHDHTCH